MKEIERLKNDQADKLEKDLFSGYNTNFQKRMSLIKYLQNFDTYGDLVTADELKVEDKMNVK